MKKQNKEMYKVPPYRTGFVCIISIIKELMKKSKGFFTKNKEFFVIYRRSMGEGGRRKQPLHAFTQECALLACYLSLLV